MKKVIILAVTLSAISTLAFGASFDCEKAGTSIEKMICGDADLSKYDDELGVLYKKAREAFPEEKKKQKAWIVERNQCDSANCLMNLYKQRNLELQAALDRASADGADTPKVREVSAIPEAPAMPKKDQVAVQAPTPVEIPTETQETPVKPNMEPDIRNQIVLWGGGLLLFGIVIAGFGFAKRCPSCGKWFSERTLRQELVDRRQGSKTVTRQDKHKDSNGNIIKTVERQEQIQITVSRYNVFHQCNKCGHEWVTTKTVESA